MRSLSKQDIIDIIYGCTLLGTGGGGSLDGALKLVEQDFREGREFMLADIDEIPDETYVAVPYVCGSVSPLTEEEEKKYKGLPSMDVTEAMRAFQAMEEYFGKPFYGIVTTELGGENTADALHVAAQLAKVIIDGDPAGRSVPELQHSTYFINDIPIEPMAVATPFGDTAIINNVVDDFRAEALVRAMSVVSKNMIGVVDHPTTKEQAKKALIPGTITYSLNIGKSLREANESGDDPAIAVAKTGGGKILFRGTVTGFSWDTIDGFTIGDMELKGTEAHEGDKYKVWFKNEHIISYLNGEVDVTVPDLICVIDKDGVPITNPFYENGMELVVIGLPAPEQWTTKRGLEVFGPKSFGFDIDYCGLKV